MGERTENKETAGGTEPLVQKPTVRIETQLPVLATPSVTPAITNAIDWDFYQNKLATFKSEAPQYNRNARDDASSLEEWKRVRALYTKYDFSENSNLEKKRDAFPQCCDR